jgi:hypothetical protein
MMRVLNAAKSSEYFDSAKDKREDSAVRAVHWAWLEHSSTVGRLEHFEPTSPLDMLLLYQAAAATFRDWPRGVSHREELSADGRVINREQAKQRLETIRDPEIVDLVTRFANQVIALSGTAAAEQDLNYYVELFLRCAQDKRIVDGILNGSISMHSKQLTDLNLW